MRLNDDQVTINVLHLPVWLTILFFSLEVIALFAAVSSSSGADAFALALAIILLAIMDIVLGFWPTQLRLDATGVTYREWIQERRIVWNDVTTVTFEILPRRDEDESLEPILERGRSGYRSRSYLDESAITALLTAPNPAFRCSMTFAGDRVITMKTGRFTGPNVKEFFAAWEFVVGRLEFFDFEVKLRRSGERHWSGVPKLLKPA